MKLASLNHLAGYSTKAYPAAVEQPDSTQYTPEEMARGYQVLREPAWNKGEFSIIHPWYATLLIFPRHFLHARAACNQ